MRLLLAAGLAAFAAGSPLWDFVNAPNPLYSWYDTGVNISTGAWTGYLLNVTSGSWLTPNDSDRYIWTHQVLVVVPANLKVFDTAALWITGGDNGDGAPGEFDEDTLVCASLATSSGTVCAIVYQIPNQPIIFPADPSHKSRGEDAAVGFTWLQYMTAHPDTPDWILYLPMARGASKAMDATTEFMAKLKPAVALKKWMAFGASKRGWTTWFLGASDARVIAIAPVVMDLLNFTAGIGAMWQSYGGWSFALQDYYDLGIPAYFGTNYTAHLAGIIDPLVYAENLTMPKLVIDATGDEFFQLQDDSFWWGTLPGESLRVMIDNAEHSMATGALYLITTVEAWYAQLLTNTPRPVFNWTISPTDGSITIHTFGRQPDQVVLRFATTPDPGRRDFRLISGDTPANPCKYIKVNVFGNACLRPIIWVGETVAPVAPNTYVLTQPLPPSGYFRAFLAELYYAGPAGTNTTLQVTTQASIIPNTFPYAPCSGQSCMGPVV